MIDRKWIGHELPPAQLPIERSRLRFFAKAIGETDPVYTDEAGVQKVKRESIKVGERRDGWAVVDKGLTEGVQVVTSGQLKLHDGVAVEGVPDTIALKLSGLEK